ncbi:MAG: acylneuraminate cytidylyltransferase family protein [Planctomycetota bacterium]
MVKFNDQVLGLIPALAGSKGVPGMDVRPLGGVPLIGHSCRTAEASGVDRVLVSTDCHEIAYVGRRYGAEVPFVLPAKRTAGQITLVSVVRQSLDHLLELSGQLPSTTVLLQTSSPFRTAEDIDAALLLLAQRNADSVVSVCEVPVEFNARWQLDETHDGMVPSTGDPLASILSRRSQLPTNHIHNGAVHAFRTRVFLETGSLYGDLCVGHRMPTERSVRLASEDDWLAAERTIAMAKQSPTRPYPIHATDRRRAA